jgi:hypothetical protein
LPYDTNNGVPSLAAWCAQVEREAAPKVVAEIDPLTLVKFIVGTPVKRAAGTFYATHYLVGDVAGFDRETCARLITEGKAVYAHETVEQPA